MMSVFDYQKQREMGHHPRAPALVDEREFTRLSNRSYAERTARGVLTLLAWLHSEKRFTYDGVLNRFSCMGRYAEVYVDTDRSADDRGTFQIKYGKDADSDVESDLFWREVIHSKLYNIERCKLVDIQNDIMTFLKRRREPAGCVEHVLPFQR